MNRNRIVKCLSAVSLVAALALPVAAHAMPITKPAASPARNHLNTPSRAAYFAAKERQYDRLENASLRSATSRDRAHRASATYAQFKDQQMQRFVNGD